MIIHLLRVLVQACVLDCIVLYILFSFTFILHIYGARLISCKLFPTKVAKIHPELDMAII